MDKTIIKVPVSVEEAQALTTSANAKGISRGEYCREVLIEVLRERYGNT